jgi:hypothetical protein
MEYAKLTVNNNKITIVFNEVAISDKDKAVNLVKLYKKAVIENTNIRLIVDCSKLISVNRNIAFFVVKNLRKFEDTNSYRFVDKTIIITKPSLRLLANLIMKFFPPVVKTNIVKSV